MANVDFIEEIRIAQYWRKQLGEYEYVHYNPDDLRRWYIALETRGSVEMRTYLAERSSRYPTGAVTGIVSVAPHPPMSVVELWLKSHEGLRTAPYWTGFAAFSLFVVLTVPYLHGCSTLKSVDRLATKPPTMSTPLQPGQFGEPARATATLPENGPPPPASAASPPTGHH